MSDGSPIHRPPVVDEGRRGDRGQPGGERVRLRQVSERSVRQASGCLRLTLVLLLAGSACAQDAGSDRWAVSIAPRGGPDTNSESVQQATSYLQSLGVGTAGEGELTVSGADPSRTGVVRVKVLGPDGIPQFQAAVNVYPSGLTQLGSAYEVQLAGKTDDKGYLTVPLPGGVQSLAVVVPGVGQGTTGQFELKPGGTKEIPLPRMAAFGQAEGRVAGIKELKDAEVSCSSGNIELARVKVGDDGAFILHDLPPGRCELRVQANDDATSRGSRPAEVFAGGWLRGVRIEPTVEEAPASAEVPPGPPGRVIGIVFDGEGHPIAHASAVVMGDPATPTDESGRFELKTPAGGVDHVLCAIRAPGFCPKVCMLPVERAAGLRANAARIVLDKTGGGLDVKVLKNGSAVANAIVVAELSDPPLPPRRAAARAPDDFADALRFARTSDADGVARFARLPPGRYVVRLPTDRAGFADASADGIAVRVGEVQHLSVARDPLRQDLSFRLAGADGSRVMKDSVGLWASSPSGEPAGAGEIVTAPWDVYHTRLRESGVRTLHVRYQDVSLGHDPYVSSEPFWETSATVVPSNLLWPHRPLELVPVHRNPGVVAVRLVDEAGRPRRGTVLLPQNSERFFPMATADSDGVVRFEGLPSGEYRVHVQPVPATRHSELSTDLPDAALGDMRVIPDTRFLMRADRTQDLVLRERSVGFVRGKLTPAKGRRAGEYGIEIVADRRDTDGPAAETRIDSETGEYICGPILPGKMRLKLFRTARPDAETSTSSEIEVPRGGVTHADLVAASPEAADGSKEESSDWPGRTPIRVLKSDGRMAAEGAWVGVIDADSKPVWIGLAAADGNAFLQPVDAPPAAIGGGAVVIAKLPGVTGIAVAPFTREAKKAEGPTLVLPPAISAAGRVTVGGNSPDRLPGRIEVLAEREDAGAPGRLMDVQTTCSADGKFELCGLSPGRYRVQATLDRAWLSQTVEIVADAGKPAASIDLKMDAPGVPVRLCFADAAGRPLADASFSLDRPKGPWADRLWAGSFLTDGVGVAYLEGLEAGRHEVLREGARVPFDVPPIADDQRLPVDTPVVLPNEKPARP